MIEDALKSTRNVYRLILTIAFVTLIFSLSIESPSDKKKQLDHINQLLSFDFLAYQGFVDEQIKVATEQQYHELSQRIKDKIEQQGYSIFNLHHIAEAFDHSPHIGRLLVEDLVLSEVNNATLNQLSALNGLSLNQNVQVVMPKDEDFVDTVIEFLQENSYSMGRRVDGVQVTLGDFNFIGNTFLPDEETLISVYFELPENIRTSGAPVFNADIPASIQSIPNTSFAHWLLEQADPSLVKQSNNKLLWLPEIKPSSNGFTETKLGLLAQQLEQDILKSSPDEQTVPVFGANIPGVLFVFAAPLLLLMLMYYHYHQILHLKSIVHRPGALEQFIEFSWMPLNNNQNWHLEFISTMIVIPLMSLSVLCVQLMKYGGVDVSVILVTLSCGITHAILARWSLTQIKAIRQMMT